jgi:predicted MPP superfamily phosphohydrolase
VVERLTLSFPNLPASFDGTTVAVISDMHAGLRRGGASSVRQVAQTASGLRPDLIVLLGDMVHFGRRANRHLPLLSGLSAPEGVWACLGNHEHGFIWLSRYLGPSRAPSVDDWRRMYADLGIQLLVNEARPVERRGSRIWIVGVDDAYSGCDDLPAALAQTQPGDFRLVITHHPNLVDHPRVAEVDLILAGHTHGGQVHIPLLGPLHVSCRKPRERARGLVRANGTTMYVTRGVGEGVPIRLGCPRELTLMTLRRSPQDRQE